MSEQRRARTVVDTHVHHWDPTNLDWYPHLAMDADLGEFGFGDVAGMRRCFDQQTYLDEAAGWDVETYVHVSTATGPGRFLDETAMVGTLAAASGMPGAIIGSADPTATLENIADQLNTQARSPNFRGIRIVAGLDYTTARAHEVLGLLTERRLVYDLVVHPNTMRAAALALEREPGLRVVVEHTGWPMSVEEFPLWRAGISVLAQRPNTYLKFSGLPMLLHEFSATAMAPWFEHCVESFTVQRCMFGSNFPVDGLYGGLGDLFATYEKLSDPLGADAQTALFASTARAVYLTT
jgi:predicted TIM-barrel fold metal-dependent hydrolase